MLCGEVQHMSTRIYCFTGTGNSLMIARVIAEGLGETEIVRISSATLDVAQESSECLGLVFPVYYGGIPAIVRKFLSNLKPVQDCYVYAVVTYAGGLGRVFSQLQAELQEIGLDLSAGFRLILPNNFLMGYSVPTDHEVRRSIDQALSRIPMIVENVHERSIYRPARDFPPYSGQRDRYLQFIDGVNESDSRFWYDDDCTQCEICVRVCPVDNIKMTNDGPLWLHRCEQCLACLNWCPESAIQFGEYKLDKGRYTNPRVTIDDMEL